MNVLLFDWLTKNEEMFSSVDSNVAQIVRKRKKRDKLANTICYHIPHFSPPRFSYFAPINVFYFTSTTTFGMFSLRQSDLEQLVVCSGQ